MIDIFKTEQYKKLRWYQKLWLRLKIAFFETIM